MTKESKSIGKHSYSLYYKSKMKILENYKKINKIWKKKRFNVIGLKKKNKKAIEMLRCCF